MYYEELKDEIKNITPLTDIKAFQRLREKVSYLNFASQESLEVYKLAREKQIL